MRRVALLLAGCAALAGCGGVDQRVHRAEGGIPPALLAAARPIGRGPRFQPPVTGPVPGACTAPLGRRLEAHIEVFGANRVVLLPAGIGTRPPRRLRDGRVVRATCFGALVTLDPTGTVYFRAGPRLTVGDVFTAWGQMLSASRIASFAGGRVRVYVDGRRQPGPPRSVPLRRGAEIVLEVGPRVPPHTHFTFSEAPSRALR